MENIATKDSSAQVVTQLPALQESTVTVKVLRSMDLTATLVMSAQDRLKTEDHLTPQPTSDSHASQVHGAQQA